MKALNTSRLKLLKARSKKTSCSLIVNAREFPPTYVFNYLFFFFFFLLFLLTVFSQLNTPGVYLKFGSFDLAFFRGRRLIGVRRLLMNCDFQPFFHVDLLLLILGNLGAVCQCWTIPLDYPKLQCYGTVHTARVPCCNQDLYHYM